MGVRFAGVSRPNIEETLQRLRHLLSFCINILCRLRPLDQCCVLSAFFFSKPVSIIIGPPIRHVVGGWRQWQRPPFIRRSNENMFRLTPRLPAVLPAWNPTIIRNPTLIGYFRYKYIETVAHFLLQKMVRPLLLPCCHYRQNFPTRSPRSPSEY